ncbi:Perforin-1 [Triplophysa tibetana]|uniref:Perforin-1 n=1 Tax=Triplophysa tibetana TaxID=1572043 RepID=A0A5A9NMC6_9TELE|nr:Perforin-1 [Triplophysa tibetana]
MAPVLLLVFLPLALCCQTAPSTECENLPFVPGHNLVGEGFDIVRMKTTGAFVVDMLNYMTGGDHGNCTYCDNKLLKKKQKLPASVVDWRIKVQCRRSLSAKVQESASSVLKDTTTSTSVSWKVGLSVPMVAGVAVGGTHSKAARFAKSHASQDKFSYTSHTFSCRYYSFRLHAQPPLTKEFKGSINTLPAQFNSKSVAAYNHFISIYGTHFLRQVDLGGRVKSTTAVRTCKVAMTGLSVQDVSNCLSAEASAVIKGVKVSAETSYCKAKKQKLEKGNSFSASFSDRVTEIMGGNGEAQDILFAPSNKSGYGVWLKTLKTLPGVVSYRLTSLHMLATHDPARKASLQAAISSYITKSALSTSCSSNCKVGRRNGNCACKCSGHQRIDSNCCPSKPGVATLKVIVVSAAGLWGDWFSKTDGYVKLFYKASADTTRVIWNNNFPQWNHQHNFGTVDLTERKPVIFEVWDRDNRWDDDLLGKVTVIPTLGTNVQKRLKLKHGTLLVSITANCGPSLASTYCEKYAPAPDSGSTLTDYNPFKPVSFQESNGLPENTFL